MLFVRGNEKLADSGEEVGGSRVYGGAILSRNPKNVHKWLKVKMAKITRKFNASNVTFPCRVKLFQTSILAMASINTN